MDLNKILKIILIIAILIIAFSVFYQYVIFMPQKDRLKTEEQKQEKLLEQLAKCREVGNKIYQEQKEDVEKGTVVVSIMMNPEYIYNKKLNTCLYAGGIITTFPNTNVKPTVTHWVIDSYTNQEIISYTESDNKRLAGINSLEEFQLKKIELFNQ